MKNLKNGMIVLIGLILLNCNLVKAGELKIHAIECNVQGDSTLLESNGKYLLMDTCSKNDNNQVLNYLKTNNVTNFDLYISHYHEDHIGLVLDILNDSKYTIKNIYLSNYFKNASLISSINTIAKEKNINVVYLNKGSEFTFGDADISIIGPIADIEKEQEALLLSSGVDLKADIMKLAHHGGYTSNTEDFIKAVSPKFAYYTSYKEASFAATSWNKQTIANVSKYTNVLSTGYNGNLIYDINNDDISITAAKNYINATLHYLNYSNNEEIKNKTYPINKNTVFYYTPEKINGYSYYGNSGLNNVAMTSNQDIKLYYQKLNSNVKVKVPAQSNTYAATINEDEQDQNQEQAQSQTTETIQNVICTEKDGIYYDKNGNIVSKEAYYTSCNVVENPKTGTFIPILVLTIILLSGLFIIKITNKIINKNKI